MRSIPTKKIYACVVYLKETLNQPQVHMPGDNVLREFNMKCQLIEKSIQEFRFVDLMKYIKMYTVKLEETLYDTEKNTGFFSKVCTRTSSRFS